MLAVTPKQILVFYDEPILFTATDAVESLYLCLLSSIPDKYDCTAIRISPRRLSEYLSRRVDLRTVFTNPEIPGEYFRVTPDGEERLILSPLDAKDLTEDRLPEEGDFIQKYATIWDTALTTKSPPKRAKTQETASAQDASTPLPLKRSSVLCSMNRANTSLTPKQCQ